MISTLELARICGVSQGTVDRALHDRAGVSQATRARVLREAAARDYRPHPAAREILTGSNPVVQAVLPAANNLFFMDLAEQIGQALAGRGLRLQIALVRDRKALIETLEDAAARRQRLSIIIPPEDGIELPAGLVRDLPMVFLLAPCANPSVLFLSPDEERTGGSGVDYLARRGHRRIAFLSSPRLIQAVEARMRGYLKEMKSRNLTPDIFREGDLRSLPDWIAERKATALFCHNDWLAVQAIQALQKRAVRIPDDLSVLGVDASPTLASLFPNLTTLAYPVEALVASILSLLDGKNASLAHASCRIMSRGTVADI